MVVSVSSRSVGLADTVIAPQGHRTWRARRVTIDIDTTVDPTHGAQTRNVNDLVKALGLARLSTSDISRIPP